MENRYLESVERNVISIWTPRGLGESKLT